MIKFLEEFKSASLHYYDQLLFVLPKVVLALIVFSIVYFIAKRLQRVLHKYLEGRMKDPLLAGFSARIFKTALIILGLLLALGIMGLGKAASGLMAGAGVTAFIIGFAFKDIGENFLAGFIMAFDRPFRIGDWVAIAGHEGKIVELSLRDVHIKTFDGRDIFIPNGMIVRNPIVNYTIDGFLRHSFLLKLAPSTDVNKALSLLQPIVNNIPGVLSGDRSSSIFIKNYDQNGLFVEVRYWLETDNPNVSSLDVKSTAINQSIKTLQEAGIELALDQVRLVNKIGG